MKVLALIDFVGTDRTKVFRTHHFPFVQALAQRCGWQTHWLSVGVDSEVQARQENPLIFDLPPEDRLLLLNWLRQVRPTHVLLNERLQQDLWLALRGAVKDADLRKVPGLVEDWFEETPGLNTKGSAGNKFVEPRSSRRHAGKAQGGRIPVGMQPTSNAASADGSATECRSYFPPSAKGMGLHLEHLDLVPNYHRELLNPLAGQIQPFTWILLGPLCLYRRPLRRNPLFAGVDLSRCNNPDACSFCEPPRQERIPADVVGAAMRQILAAESTTPLRCRSRQYVINGAALWPKLGPFLDQVLAQLLPPSAFFIHCRADEILRGASQIETRLSGLEAAGHSLNVFNIGVENFSPTENLRFNKGLSNDDVFSAARLMSGWERRNPRAFFFTRHGGFSFILYTPWTTLEDLEQNIHGLRKLRPLCHGVSFALKTRLQLLPGRAITALAKEDGLLAQTFDDHLFDSGCITDWDINEHPWTFEDQRVALLYRFSRRLVGDDAIPADDPDLITIRRWRREQLPAGRRDLLVIFAKAVETVKSRPETIPLDTLLRDVARSLSYPPGAGAPLSVDLGAKGIQLCVKGPCDLACVFCNLFHEVPQVDEEAHFTDLKEEIGRLAAQGICSASWGMFHHEPTQFSRLPALLRHARSQGITSNLLITNGIRTRDPAYLGQLREAGVDAISLTLVEYDEASADEICQGRGVVAARQQTLDNCRSLGIKIHPVILLMRANYQRVFEMLNLYSEAIHLPTLQLIQPTMEDRVAWFLPPLSGVLEAVMDAARRMPSQTLTLHDIPRCIQERQGPPPSNLLLMSTFHGVFAEACGGCPWRAHCCGFQRQYLEIYGGGEAFNGEVLHNPLSLTELDQLKTQYIKNRRSAEDSSDDQGDTGELCHSAPSHRLLAIITRLLRPGAPPRSNLHPVVTDVRLAHHERAAVTLQHGGAHFRILVAWKEAVGGAFMIAGPFALMHPRGEPFDRLSKLQAVKLLARLLERQSME